MPFKFFRNIILIPIFLFQACIPSLSKGFLQSITDFLQFRSLTSAGPSGPFKISFTVSGLLGSGLVVNLNSGSETLTINADGKYDFSTVLSSGNNFNVSIQTQPTLPTQTCSVSGGSGVVGKGNIDSILINCDPLRYALSGTITGLDGVTGLVLTNSFDGSTRSVAVSSGTFAFTQTYLDGTSYNVSVTTQPNHPVQNCVTANGVGVIAGADITNINITCTSTAFPIEVKVVGMSSGTLAIRNNNSEILTIATNGTHMFPTDVVINNTYNLQVTSQPTNHQCVLSPSTGVVTTSITVTANCFSMLNVNPSLGGVLQPTESIRLQFSDAINAGSCTGSTGLNTNLGIPVLFALSTTAITDDTLTVSPAPTDSWVYGNSTLTLNCISNSGYSLSTTVNIPYLVPSTIRYVSQTSGNDAFDGLTPFSPKRNIQEAINDLGGCPTFDCAVLVEGGWYDSTVIGDKIQLTNGVSLYGGYVVGSNFGTWDPDSHSSQILMIATPASCSTSTQVAPCAALVGDVSIVNDTTVSGFFIKSGPNIAPYMAGVLLDSTAKVRLINNAIDAGTGISGSYGVSSINSNPLLVKNLVDGGKCSLNNCESIGLYMSSTFPISPVLLLNVISGGGDNSISGAKSKGVQFVGTSTMTVSNITGNIILSKDLHLASTTDSVAFEVSSTASTSSNGILSGNIIKAGEGSNSIGIRIQVISAIEIGSTTQGNTIVSTKGVLGSYGLFLTGGHVVRRNAINVGNAVSTVSSANATGVYMSSGGTAIVENNSIDGANATSTVSANVYGIKVNGLSATSRITGNYIRTGTATGATTSTSASGINLDLPSNALVANNWIQNGTSNQNAYGIELIGMFSGLRIYHNTISSGSTPLAGKEAPIFIKALSSGADIQNNVMLLVDNAAGNACIINSGTGVQAAIKYNVFHNCTSFVAQGPFPPTLYPDLCGGGIPSTSGCVSPLGVVANFGNNLNIDPNFVSNFGTPANYTPTSATSCLITKSTNNILTDSFNGNGTRPGADGAVSLGAIEYEHVCTP
ncbi:hypothetical protein ND856_16275 [Leptospira bandrabouensis]|uniref:hypothetical protein n=1 Tax=Leptospira bandrabouensis TaxID=2484903 RepID=UPI00223D7473|nr:hypothetical protein [Leptospira bandrabouensis]MCW7458400.1 hypothetical protein [Leptospira bandrabouensis]MCW7478853.1 hypothetical protein [Leptospira bandrabouensis]MCW7486483.1 hypothetical protein [Leptospira bandrabouensis]